jgi:Sulfotransferase family
MNPAALWATLANPLRPIVKHESCRRWLARMLGKEYLHFLHIGKTGGSAIKFVFAGRPLSRDYVILLHEHDVPLEAIPVGQKYFFVLRNPIARFTSAFYSRQRCGRPRIYSPWTEQEAVAFERFASPDDLAKSLTAKDEASRTAAEEAMRGIRHLSSSYWDWFRDETYFESRRSDLFFIGFQESLDACFERLVKKLGWPERIRLPSDDIAAHRNPQHLRRALSEEAKSNLRDWYAADLRFYERCQQIQF